MPLYSYFGQSDSYTYIFPERTCLRLTDRCAMYEFTIWLQHPRTLPAFPMTNVIDNIMCRWPPNPSWDAELVLRVSGMEEKTRPSRSPLWMAAAPRRQGYTMGVHTPRRSSANVVHSAPYCIPCSSMGGCSHHERVVGGPCHGRFDAA